MTGTPLVAGPAIFVRCFGGLRVVSAHGEAPVEGAAAGYQAWAILAFLAAQPDGSATTEAEDVARTPFRCYGELGDRPALLREYRYLREQLRRALAGPGDSEAPDEADDSLYEPEAETVAVHQETLARLERESSAGAAAHAAG